MTAPGTAVKVVHSGNSGASYDAAVTVSNAATGTEYLLPQLVITASGTLEALYYQGSSMQPATLERAYSTDSGATFTVVDLAMPGTFNLDRGASLWLGDYVGLFAAGNTIYTSYGNNSTLCARSTSQYCDHISFAKWDAP
jgi:hypothetical protein